MTPPFPLWIVDSSPMITLAKVGRLDLLTASSRRVLLTQTVVREVEAGRAEDPARLALDRNWGECVADAPIPDALAAWGLDAGEEATLALALTWPQSLAIVDDSDARRAASALGIPVTGTVGVALQARQSGRIMALAPLLHDLRAVGLFLPKDSLLNEVLKTVGETWP